MTRTRGRDSGKETLALDVAALRQRLGPAKVALIEQWIREINGPLNAIIARHMHPTALVLDAGCSRGDPDLPALLAGRYTVGCDMDLLGLRANELAHGVVLAPLGKLPFPDNTFDLIACKWVLEHLEQPEIDLGECRRVLKPGGTFIALTPNAYSAFTLISRFIPYRLKQILKGNMFGVHEEDTFRTWYRANSRGRLARLARSVHFETEHLEFLPGMWTFFIFVPFLARLVRRLEDWQRQIPAARGALTYIIGVWKKPGDMNAMDAVDQGD
ncbi:MAG: class I SAM-dependent methyltransferase [Candidatus Hydrogenedentes bacterium]|nr:class I SAM-dependent methyltransferase [Candidatus Hydrogenedentota bacterium]